MIINKYLGGALHCALALAATTATALAQVDSTPAVASFSGESVLAFDRIGATATPAIPANMLAAIQAGALEGRQSLQFDPQNMRLTVRTFLVQPNAPLPTPSTVDVSNFLLSNYTIQVDRVYRSTTPFPSVMFVGTVQSNPVQDPFGNLTGAPAVVSVGYTAATATTPLSLNNAVVLIAGRVVSFAPSAGGNLTFPGTPPPDGEQPPPATGPTVNLARTTIDTPFPQVTVDASGSTNPGGGTLTYSWRVVRGNAAILNPTSAVTDVQLIGFRGSEYVLEVTARNAAGQTAARQVTIRYF